MRLDDTKDPPRYDCTADQIGPSKQGWKWCDWSKRFIAESNPYQREYRVLKLWRSEKGRKQATVLATGRKCRKHWHNRGIPNRVLQPFIMPVVTG